MIKVVASKDIVQGKSRKTLYQQKQLHQCLCRLKFSMFKLKRRGKKKKMRDEVINQVLMRG